MPTDLLGREYETFAAPEPLKQHGPARVLAMCNQKGGVGKTTSSINIAGAMCQYGRRVLIVDFDPQGAATVGLGINANSVDNTIYTAMPYANFPTFFAKYAVFLWMGGLVLIQTLAICLPASWFADGPLRRQGRSA